VPAKDHDLSDNATAWRPVWPDDEDWPRFVGKSRGSTYEPLPGQSLTKPAGFIKQVAHTYAYFDGNYAVQNEHQVSFGESTASSPFRAIEKSKPGGTALFSVNELSRVAAERTKTAREAVQLMGDLAVEYGFYGADDGAGEVLMVGDTEEAFVFHILSDNTAKSAIWVAQRVPDDHIAVVANMFSIREVDLTDSHTFLGSDNMFDIAKKFKLWDGKGKLDFTGAFSGGEYGSKYYTGRRVWDGYRHFAADWEKLPTEYDDLKRDKVLPFSMKVAKPLTVHDMIKASRSHYEGTEFDMTKGLAAGPFGTPDRYGDGAAGEDGYGAPPPKLAWERTVAIYRTDVTWMAQASAKALGTVWWAPADPSKSVYAPLMVSAESAPKPYIIGNAAKLDRGSAYWAHRYVSNIAQIKYSYMIKDIEASALALEAEASKVVAKINEKGCKSNEIKKLLDAHAETILSTTWELTDALMVKYADGGLTTANTDGTGTSIKIGYPTEWLTAITGASAFTVPKVGELPGGADYGLSCLPGPTGRCVLPEGAPNPVTSLTTRGTSVAPPPLVKGGGPAATSMAAVPWVMAATGWVVAAALFARRHRGSTAAAPATGGDYAAFR